MGSDILFVLAALGVGAIFGSFINALSFRFNTGKSMGGRSQCMCCGHQLSAADLIPVFSYGYLGGRCRYCHARVSLQYPAVELLAAALSLGVFFAANTPLAYVAGLLVWMIILFIIVYDLRHMIIPHVASVALMISVLAHMAVVGNYSWHLLLAGPLLALPFVLLSLVSGGRWMGWGDSGFELSLGWLLGPTLGLTALMLAVWSGALVGVLIIALQKILAQLTPTRPFLKSLHGFTIKSEIPFAPFLAFGAAIAYFFHVNFFQTLSLFF